MGSQKFKFREKASEDVWGTWTKIANGSCGTDFLLRGTKGSWRTERDVPRELRWTGQGKQDPHRAQVVQPVVLEEERAFCIICVYFSGPYSTTVSQNCVGGVMESWGLLASRNLSSQ